MPSESKKEKPEEQSSGQMPQEKSIEWNYPIQDIIALRNSLVEVLMHEFLGKIPEGDRFEAMVDMVVEQLPPTIMREIIKESLRPLVGTRLDESIIRQTCHLIAGNQARLKALRPVRTWTTQRFPEWVPVQIMACNRTLNKRGEPGAMFVFKVIAGTPASLLIRKFWSNKLCRYVATKYFGFERVRRHAREGATARTFDAIEQLVTMRLYVLVESKACYEGKPGFIKMDVPPSLRAWNLGQVRLRHRTLPMLDQCKLGKLPIQMKCHHCKYGYNSCRGGTHASDHVFQHCDVCGEDNVPFDADRSTAACVGCYMKNAWKKK